MPKLMDTTLSQAINVAGSHFQFSGVRPENLGATEYTLATVALDASGSVQSWRDELLNALAIIVETCRISPRADNLLLRVTAFSERAVKELHGFKPLSEIDVAVYDNQFHPNGMTPLYDATTEGLTATVNYATLLQQQGFSCNGCVFVATDGMDNRSTTRPQDVAKQIAKARAGEAMESLQVVLIGINTSDSTVHQYLNDFQRDGKLDRYIDAGEATAEKLAYLADFISSSIISQSQSLGTGKASQPLNYSTK